MQSNKISKLILKSILVTFSITSVTSCLSGCSEAGFKRTITKYNPIKVYKMDVKQGNKLDQNLVDKIKKGQTKEEVKKILGAPPHIPALDQDTWVYDYYVIPGTKDTEAIDKKLRIKFKNNKVISVVRD